MTRPWTAEEFPALATWIVSHAQPLERGIEASKRSCTLTPIVSAERPKVFSQPVQLMMFTNTMGEGLVCRAMLRLGPH